RDDRIGVEIVAGPLIRVPIRTGIANAPIGQIEGGIVRACDPDRSAAMLPGLGIAERFGGLRTRLPGFEPGLTRSRNRIEAPDLAASSRVIRSHEPANAELAAADADNHLVLDRERRERERIAGL